MKAGLREIRKNLAWRLRLYRAGRARARSGAVFIGVTGSSGKSTAAGLLGHILAGQSAVHTQILANAMTALVNTLYKRVPRAGPLDYVVFEAGAFGVGTIRPMAEMLKPHVAVVTMVRLEHLSSFRTLENVAQEKRALVEALEPGGLAVLNADDPNVLAMASGQHRFVTFGESEAADYRVTDISAAYPRRLSFTLLWRAAALDLQTSFPGAHFWLPVAAAAATALELGVLPQTVADRVATFEPLANRCQVITTDGGPHFIVDCAKAPGHSVGLAFEMLASSTFDSKRIVLGQLSDFTGSNIRYARAYESAREIAGQVIYVGEHAHRSKASQDDRDIGRFVELRTPKEVSDHIKRTAAPGELVLLKSSSNLHLERIALAWSRDVKCWIPACGKKEGCLTCGLYEVPFDEHRDFVRKRKFHRRLQRLRRAFGG
ncbi:Mur ligase family protein [Mesorhizobium sp.]|uniref:Mur ligase family protein n=1 Tax=Mesorhizobium sp. TaxID=1871066 RepID=UPI0025D8230D|nr:Mur ligase family protein [Mesorhizobium sp.]